MTGSQTPHTFDSTKVGKEGSTSALAEETGNLPPLSLEKRKTEPTGYDVASSLCLKI
jgi:hypothetical protein